MSDQDRKNGPALSVLPALAAVLAAGAFVIESARSELGLELSPDGKYELYEFGWPLPFLQAQVERETLGDSLLSIIRSREPEVLWGGMLCNLVLVTWLAVTAGFAGSWVAREVRPRLTLGALLGLLGFAGYEAATYWRPIFVGRPDWTLEFDLELIVVGYTSSLIWSFILIGCLWTPYLIGQILKTILNFRSRNRSRLVGSSEEG
jgi:hypothetical protein